MKIFQSIPSLAVASVLAGGCIHFMSGCGDSSSSTAPTQVNAMPQDQQENIRKAMEANKVQPGKGKTAKTK